jgi:hypothetical protein
MKAMLKFWMALVVGVAVMAITVPSWADPVPEVPKDDAQGWIGPLSATLTSTFTGGIVTSWVFNAAGAAAGFGFVYVYQVKNTFTKKMILPLTTFPLTFLDLSLLTQIFHMTKTSLQLLHSSSTN